MIKPPTGFTYDWITDKSKSVVTDYITSFASDYLSAMPIMAGVAIGVYALGSMISQKLGKFGAVGVFIYGALVVIS